MKNKANFTTTFSFKKIDRSDELRNEISRGNRFTYSDLANAKKEMVQQERKHVYKTTHAWEAAAEHRALLVVAHKNT